MFIILLNQNFQSGEGPCNPMNRHVVRVNLYCYFTGLYIRESQVPFLCALTEKFSKEIDMEHLFYLLKV